MQCLQDVGTTPGTIELERDHTYDSYTFSSAVIVEDIMYYNTFNRTYAIDIEDGSEIWNYSYMDAYTFASSPAVDLAAGVVAISGRGVVVLDIDDGTEIWSEDLGAYEFAAN